MYGQQRDRLVGTSCQIFPIKSVLYCKVNKIQNQLVKFDSFVWYDVLLTVQLPNESSFS
jgi:hypothetical protein